MDAQGWWALLAGACGVGVVQGLRQVAGAVRQVAAALQQQPGPPGLPGRLPGVHADLRSARARADQP